jgi:glycosyltransferase involved in cell wall biosynthesis
MITTFLPERNSSNQTCNSALPHVLLVLDQFPETLGGGERVVLRLAELLPQYGYHASILTFAIHPKSSALRYAKCPIHLLALQRVYDLNALRASFAFRNFLRLNRIQIVQTFFESSDLWAGLITKTMSEARLIWSRRDMGILRTYKHHLGYRAMARMPDAVFAVSDQVRKHCIEVDHIDPNCVFTIYNGLDICSWPNASRPIKPSGEVLIVAVGNIRRVKGHDIFIRAAAQILVEYPRVQFSIAGEVLEPEFFAELRNLVRDLGLSDSFHFAGDVTNLPEHLARADIFVLPSRSEGFSNAIIEAMAASLPVVATNVGGNAEAVIDAVNGFLVPSEDVDALSLAIRNLVSDPSRARAMGMAGRGLVEEKFTSDAMMKRIVAKYDNLVAKSGVARPKNTTSGQ